MNSKKAVIVGAGSIGKRHAQNLKSLGVNVTFIRRKTDLEFDQKFDVNSITWSEFKNDTMVYDYGFICSPTNLHIKHLNELYSRVNRIFLEKPLCSSFSNIEDLEKTVDPNKVFIGFMLRFHPAIKVFKKLTNRDKSKILGGTFHFGSFMPNWHPNEDYLLSYAARKEMGGGVVRTISHELDLALWFFGEPTSVFAYYNNLSRLNINTEERASILLIYKTFTINVNLNYLEKHYHRSIDIYWEDSRVKWDWNENKIVQENINTNLDLLSIDNFEVNQLYKEELEFFIANTQFDDQCNLNHAIKIQRLIEKLDESNSKNKIINLW